MATTEIGLCNLCKENVADKTGSHIIPAFIISSGLNQKGDRGRDKELYFSMSSANFTKAYFKKHFPNL